MFHLLGALMLCASRASGPEGLKAFGPSIDLPYLEIKLTFECTAWFYGLAPPLVLLRLSKSASKPRFFGKTEPNRNQGFMPLCCRFRKRSSSSVLTVPWTLITRGLAGVTARVVADCAGGAALLRVRGRGWGLERLNEWRTVRTGERRWTVGG